MQPKYKTDKRGRRKPGHIFHCVRTSRWAVVSLVLVVYLSVLVPAQKLVKTVLDPALVAEPVLPLENSGPLYNILNLKNGTSHYFAFIFNS